MILNSFIDLQISFRVDWLANFISCRIECSERIF